MKKYEIRVKRRSKEFLQELYNTISKIYPNVKIDGLNLRINGNQQTIEVLELIESQKPETPNKRIKLYITSSSSGTTREINTKKEFNDVIECLKQESSNN